MNIMKIIDNSNFWEVFAKAADMQNLPHDNTCGDYDPEKNTLTIRYPYLDTLRYPNLAADNIKPGPFIILIHFSNTTFAKMDTVHASAEYRFIYEEEENPLICGETRRFINMFYIVSDNAWTSFSFLDLPNDDLSTEENELLEKFLDAVQCEGFEAFEKGKPYKCTDPEFFEVCDDDLDL